MEQRVRNALRRNIAMWLVFVVGALIALAVQSLWVLLAAVVASILAPGRSGPRAVAPGEGNLGWASVRECPPAELHADAYARCAYSTLANGQFDSSHSLTACQRGVSRCAWLSRTHESAQASLSLSRSG